MLVKPLQPRNALSPILVTLFGIVILVNPLQAVNAEEPILVTLFGIVILVNPLQPENAQETILVPPVITTVFNVDGIEEL